MAGEIKRSSHTGQAEIIEKKIRKFIHRFYWVRVLQGSILTTLIVILLFFLAFFLDFIFDLTSIQNGILFWLVIATGSLAMAYFIFKPAAQALGIIRGMNYKEAGRIIAGKHQGIEDRIINIIELNREGDDENILVEEAINQKTEKIKWYNFYEALSLRQLARIALGSAIILTAAALLTILWPGFVERGYQAVFQYKRSYSDNQVRFEILSGEMKVEAGKNYDLQFRIVSKESVISQAEINVGSRKQKIYPVDGIFSYTIYAINNPVSFTISAGSQESQDFTIEVLRKPEIGEMKITVIPPRYTGLEKIETVSNGNVEIPAGSRVIWSLKTVYTDTVRILQKDTITKVPEKNRVQFESLLTDECNYTLQCINKSGLTTEYVYNINVLRDLYPDIDIAEKKDTAIPGYVFINGSIEDDFGFTKLEMVEKKENRETTNEVEIDKNKTYQIFYKTVYPDTVESVIFFRIFDNDLIMGPKSAESKKINLKNKSIDEIKEENKEKAENIEKNLDKSIGSIEEIENKIIQLRMQNMAGELSRWEIQERVNEINDMKNSLLELINNIKEENEEYTGNEEQTNDDLELIKKAKEIEDLLKNIVDDELKKLLEEFGKLANDYNERLANEATEKIEMNLEKMKEQMEMTIELLKKYEIEKNITERAKELRKLSETLEKSEKSEENLKEETKEGFRQWEDKYEKNLEENKKLKEPIKLEEFIIERQEINDSINEYVKSGDQEIKKSKKCAARKISELADNISNMLGESMENSQMVDIEELRQIRNALNDFSMAQEKINENINRFQRITRSGIPLPKEQKILQEKFGKISDSLKSLGYKQPIIAKISGEELFHVETSMKNIFENMRQNRLAVVKIEQNKIMSEVNNLVLKIDELIKGMERREGTGSGKSGFKDSRKKDKGEGDGSEEISDAKKMQESLKEQLKTAIKQLSQGKNGEEVRQELSKMLGEREMMRKKIERLAQSGIMGSNTKERLQQAAEMMKDVEKDIVYNRMGNWTMEKDEWIRTRLLEAENAEKERENDNRRESKEFRGEFKPDGKDILKEEQANKLFRQSLKYKELKLKEFYNEKYRKYIEEGEK